MSGDTVARRDYTAKVGERYDVKIPRDSGITQGDGTFTLETQKSRDFVPKKGERYEVVKQQESDIWQHMVRTFFLLPNAIPDLSMHFYQILQDGEKTLPCQM